VGRVPPEKIHDYYHRAKGLINTSVYEGFPNTFLEAARYGTPIASLQIDSGRFFDGAEYAQGSFERLVDLTERLTHSPVCERKGRQLRESFESQYDVTTVARQYKEALTAGARYP
jgi:glycosyltransferase involved in cell wall biosynthesis